VIGDDGVILGEGWGAVGYGTLSIRYLGSVATPLWGYFNHLSTRTVDGHTFRGILTDIDNWSTGLQLNHPLFGENYNANIN